MSNDAAGRAVEKKQLNTVADRQGRDNNDPSSNDSSNDVGGGSNPAVVSPKGTIYFGGAGLDGNYIDDMADALRESGIGNVYALGPDGLSVGPIIDASIGYLVLRNKMSRFPHTLRLPNGSKGQLNIVGYSFGSLYSGTVVVK